MARASLLAGLLWAIAPSAVRADTDDEATVWYGWQTLSMDVAALGLILPGAILDESSVFVAGMGAFIMGTPLVHVANGRSEIAPVSLALRAGVPVLFGIVGAVLAKAGEGRQDTHRLILVRAGPGLVIGGLLAMLVDAKLLAYRRPDEAGLRASVRIDRSSLVVAAVGRF